MEATARAIAERERLDDELATMAAHLNAATARWLGLLREFQRASGPGVDPCDRWLAFRCGLSLREARAYVQVAEALEELPAIRASFGRGELSFSKVRALVRVATPASEEGLLELASVLTASQLERALRAYRRVTRDEARESHELEYVDYYWDEDGSLVLRARLAAEEGTILVKALDAARERLRERRRQEQTAASGEGTETAVADWEARQTLEPRRSPQVEALVELAETALGAPAVESEERFQIVVHVDAEALVADGAGRSELADGPVISPETARRLGCDAKCVTSIERTGIPVSVGRRRRTVPPRLRRLLEARDEGACRWPGCDRGRHLQAHHRTHWAQGGDTALDNLLLLCFHHHRLVHEGGYTIEHSADGELRFRNRYGVLCPTGSRPPPGDSDELLRQDEGAGLSMTPLTNRNGFGEPMDLAYAVDDVLQVMNREPAQPVT